MSGPTPTPLPLAASRHDRFRRLAGFTMVELLTIIVIISILFAIGLSVSKAITVRQSLAKAQGDMDLICSALEQFHRDNLEYPPMDNDQGSGSPYAEQNLLLAIAGHARWTIDQQGQPLWETVSMAHKLNDGSNQPQLGEKYNWGKQYVELSKLQIDTDAGSESGYKDGATIHDPWWDGDSANNSYLYRYKQRKDLITPASRNWQATSYLLVSRGPDGKPEDPEGNFVWKSVNRKGTYTGLLSDDYADPVSNPDLGDNLVRGTFTMP